MTEIRGDFKKKLPPKPVERDDFGRPKKNKSSFFNKLLIFVASFVLIMCIAIVGFSYLEDYLSHRSYKGYSDLYNSINEQPDVSDVTTQTPEDDTPRPLLPMAEELLEKNPETVGWINLSNTKISYPVVLHKDESQPDYYYLTHDFDGNNSRAGAIFADHRTTITDRHQSDNIVLYGHNEYNNTMFGDLDLYKSNGGKNWTRSSLEFYKQNPTFEFDTNYEKDIYKIFAVFVTETKQENDPDYPLFDYNNFIDFSEDRYNEFMYEIELRNRIITDIDCQYGDRFVTLSTCSNETDSARLVVIGRKVRDGEDASVNTDNVIYNEDAHSPDWNAIYNR